MTPRDNDEYEPDVCRVKHTELDRRMTSVESSLQRNFDRMYEKIETQTLHWAKEAADNAKRPGWATTVLISLLSALCVGLAVAAYQSLMGR